MTQQDALQIKMHSKPTKISAQYIDVLADDLAGHNVVGTA